MYKIFSSVALILFSCSYTGIELSKGETFFVKDLFSRKGRLQKGTTIVFILNQSGCSPCEEQVEVFYSGKFKGADKLFVISENRAPTRDEAANFITFPEADLAQYGLIRANGTVLVFKNGKCVLLKSIDLLDLKQLTEEVKEVIR